MSGNCILGIGKINIVVVIVYWELRRINILVVIVYWELKRSNIRKVKFKNYRISADAFKYPIKQLPHMC